TKGEAPIAVIGVNSSPSCGVSSTYYGDNKTNEAGVFMKRFSKYPLIDVKQFAKYHIYLAAPLFSESQRRYNETIASFLASKYYDVYLPQSVDDTVQSRQSNREKLIYQSNINALKQSDIVVAIIDGSDVDSGTAWEMGYAKAMGKRVIAIRSDFRKYSKSELVNLMLESDIDVISNYMDLVSVIENTQCQ
ncbi:MAG TPA: nucleoside 2-deoxyribosyltransferase, partial [Methanocorpusculum sp.]|nr:nucleoside 2-deoxyribosyltransferase [Methanocorpusculum sp.]